METDLLEIKTWTSHFAETTVQFKKAIFGYLPNLVGAIVVLLLGLLLAKLCKYLGTKFGQLVVKFLATLEKKYNVGHYKLRPNHAAVLGHVFYWIVLIYFVFFALRVLSIPGITAWITHFTSFIPNLVGALVIIYVGFLLGALTRNFIYSGAEQRGGGDPYFLAQSLRFGVITLFVIWGVGQVGINVMILTSFINIIVAAIFGAAALGFGLGASAHVANMIGAYNFKKSFQVGDSVTLDGQKGVIVDITSHTIVLETTDGMLFIPAKKVLDSISQKGG